MKLYVFSFLTVVFAAQGVALAQEATVLSPISPDSKQVMCVVDGSDVVVMVPEADCQEGHKAATTGEKKIVTETTAERPSRFNRILDKNGIEANVKFLDVDLLEGVSFGAKYKYEVDKSEMRPDYFMRVDRYVMGVNINPGAWIDSVTPLSIGFGHETEIMFTRYFKTGAEARKLSNGYLPKALPVNAEKALALAEGTYVRFNARMNANLGVGQGFADIGLIEASVGLNFVMSGEFQVHVFRLDHDRVRLKLIALRGNETSLGLKLGIKPQIFGVDSVDKQFVRIAKLDHWLEAKAAKSKTDLFMVDYVLNLKDPRALAAYNGMFTLRDLGKKSLETFKIMNPTTKAIELGDHLLSEVKPLEDLATDPELIKVAAEVRPVNRLFKGVNTAHTLSADFRFGVQLVKFEMGASYRSNFLARAVVDPATQAPVIDATTGKEQMEYFLIPVWGSRSRIGGLIFRNLGAFSTKVLSGEEYSYRSANALFKADQDGNPTQFENISFERVAGDTYVKDSEYDDARTHILSVLPASGKAKLREATIGTGWDGSRNLEDAGMTLDYFFNAKALGGLEAAGWADQERLVSAMFKYLFSRDPELTVQNNELNQMISIMRDPSTSKANYDKARASALKIHEDLQAVVSQNYGDDITDMSKKLLVVLSKDLKVRPGENIAKKRVAALTDLRSSSFFKNVGPGFLVYLLSDPTSKIDVDQVMYSHLKLNAAQLPGIDIESGDNKYRDLYDVVEFVQSLMDGREVDMRLAGPTDSNTTKVDYEELVKRLRVTTNAAALAAEASVQP